MQFAFLPLTYVHHRNKIKRRFIPGELHVTIKFRGRTIDACEGFLNEARLSALAISLFLAGVLASNPAPPPGHDPLQLLVLDDVLFGLDMANRIPVLKILKERFANYQVLLLTHDLVWYDIARGQLPENDGWSHQRLIADEAQGLLVPRIRPGLSDLAPARKHLNNEDLKAAAVYARAAFEVRIQNACEKNGIQVAYRRDVNEVTLDKLWTAIVERTLIDHSHESTESQSRSEN